MDPRTLRPDPVLHALIRQLPLPMVLFGTGAGRGLANDRFAALFHPGQVDGPELQRLMRQAGDGWRTVALRRRDGGDGSARAEAIAVPHGVLVVVDDATGQLSGQEYARLQQRIAELEQLGATDRLTGAWNRVQLERTVAMEMKRAARSGQPVTFILLDIDRFKRVNDVHGHLVGDAVLKEFAARIRGRMRGTDSLFRWGGEEFIVLAVGVGHRGGSALAESLRATVEAEPFGTVGPVTASLGVAEYQDGESAESWFQRTDRALYAAKNRGRNCVHVDPRGTSDAEVERADVGVLRLEWREAYESGERTIDAQHRELFRLGNALITAAIGPHATPSGWRRALAALLTHVTGHFRYEEAVLARHGYAQLTEHRRAHVVLLKRARQLETSVNDDERALGALVDFVVGDVVAGHIFTADRDFYPLLQQGAGGAHHVGG